ncbi:chloride channel CLIC-like protein 1 isoform 2-T2 [Pholidichthys leucotaenia]
MLEVSPGKCSSLSTRVLLVALVCCLSLSAVAQEVDDWLDPYDMLNYDASSKTMRKPAKPSYAVTKRRDHIQDSNQDALTVCNKQVGDLQRQIEEKEKIIAFVSQQPTCTPVFKRFLSRLLKEIKRVGVPGDSSEVHYDALIKLSKQTMTEIQSLLEGEDRWRTGALDNAISQILVDLKAHDYQAWKWRFEDTFGVELDTLIKIGIFVLIVVAIVCTQLWSTVSWFFQFSRVFAICFVVSIVWNWFYLYKIAFAEHQNNIVKMDSVNAQCTGVKKIDWTESLKEWYRSTWTLQDDPCKKYYEVLMVNPILLVPPTKAISVTITTFITEPLKHFGQGISDFLRALLKDLPITLQIPVLVTIVLAILVLMYGSTQAAFQHGIMGLLHGPRRDPPPPPAVEQPQPQPRLRIEDCDHLAGGDAPAPAQYKAQRQPVNDPRINRNDVRQRQPNVPKRDAAVETIRPQGTADPLFSEDEMDAARQEGGAEAEPNLSDPSDSQNQQEELQGQSANTIAAKKDQTKPTKLDSSKPKNNKHSNVEDTISQAEPRGEDAEPRSQSVADVENDPEHVCDNL